VVIWEIPAERCHTAAAFAPIFIRLSQSVLNDPCFTADEDEPSRQPAKSA
jgi:hypothetical protein